MINLSSSRKSEALQEGQAIVSAAIRFPQNEQISLVSQKGHRFQCSFTAFIHTGQVFDVNGNSHAGQIFHTFSTGSPHFGQVFFFSDNIIIINKKLLLIIFGRWCFQMIYFAISILII
jgi:hypothetical protein